MTDETKHILLTGSSGFLGQHLLYQLLARGDPPALTCPGGGFHVYALYGKSEGFPKAVQHALKAQNVTIESLDFTDGDAIKGWFERHPLMDVCIHSAALSSPRVCQDDPQKAAALNIPKALFEGLHNRKCHIIALSTDQVYDGDKGEMYLETDEAKPVNVYGATKLEMESFLRELTGNKAVVLRSSIILGKKAPIAKAHDTFLHFCATREGTPTDFYSDECRSVVSVNDVIHTILWFVQRFVTNENDKIGGVYNMGGPQSMSRVDMAKAVFDHLAFDKTSIVSTQKVALPPGPVPSPLDISMDSSKLESLLNRKFEGIDMILQSTFPR